MPRSKVRKFPRYTTWADETSGVGGKNRPTTYGVWDNKHENKHYIDGFEPKSRAEAQIKADELNRKLRDPFKY